MAATHVNEARKAQAALLQAQNLIEINAKLDLIMAKLGIELVLSEPVEPVKQEASEPAEPAKQEASEPAEPVKQEAARVEPEKKTALKSAGSK